MLSKSQRDHLRGKFRSGNSIEAESARFSRDEGLALLDAADELAEIKRLPVVESLRDTIQMQEAELRHLRERVEALDQKCILLGASLRQAEKAEDELERLREGLRGLDRHYEAWPDKAPFISAAAVESLLNNGGDDGE